jgi:hypothetical protein
VYTPLATTYTALFACDFVQRSTVSAKFSFLLEVSKELPQRSTLNTFFRCSQLSRCLFAQFNPVCSCIFYFCVCATLSSVRPIFCPTVASNFCSSWDEYLANLWILPTFSDPQNMSCDDLTSPVAVAATSQVKLCPYNEEEPHIWFCLMEAQFNPIVTLTQSEGSLSTCLYAFIVYIAPQSPCSRNLYRQSEQHASETLKLARY